MLSHSVSASNFLAATARSAADIFDHSGMHCSVSTEPRSALVIFDQPGWRASIISSYASIKSFIDLPLLGLRETFTRWCLIAMTVPSVIVLVARKQIGIARCWTE